MNISQHYDYFYYLITRLMFRFDGSLGFTAIAFISISQTVILLDVVEIILVITNNTLKGVIGKDAFLGLLGLVAILILYVNYKKYAGTYSKLKSIFRNGSFAIKFSKSIVSLIVFIFPFFLFFWLLSRYGE